MNGGATRTELTLSLFLGMLAAALLLPYFREIPTAHEQQRRLFVSGVMLFYLFAPILFLLIEYRLWERLGQWLRLVHLLCSGLTIFGCLSYWMISSLWKLIA